CAPLHAREQQKLSTALPEAGATATVSEHEIHDIIVGKLVGEIEETRLAIGVAYIHTYVHRLTADVNLMRAAHQRNVFSHSQAAAVEIAGVVGVNVECAAYVQPQLGRRRSCDAHT